MIANRINETKIKCIKVWSSLFKEGQVIHSNYKRSIMEIVYLQPSISETIKLFHKQHPSPFFSWAILIFFFFFVKPLNPHTHTHNKLSNTNLSPGILKIYKNQLLKRAFNNCGYWLTFLKMNTSCLWKTWVGFCFIPKMMVYSKESQSLSLRLVGS